MTVIDKSMPGYPALMVLERDAAAWETDNLRAWEIIDRQLIQLARRRHA